VVAEGEWSFPKDQGTRYAGVVNDYNPIHLYKFTANLFGFKKPIAHGMFVCGKAFTEALEKGLADGRCARGRPNRTPDSC
jgi:acyl dehydratase